MPFADMKPKTVVMFAFWKNPYDPRRMLDCLSGKWQALEDHPSLPELIRGYENTTWSNNRTQSLEDMLSLRRRLARRRARSVAK